MKYLRIITVSIFVFSLFTTAAFAARNDLKIGYVDLSRLFDEYYKTKEYDKVLEVEHKDFESQSKVQIEKIRESQGKLALLKDDEKEKIQKEIEDKKASLLEFDRKGKTNLTKKRNEKIRELLLEIEKVVSDYAEKKGYSIVLNDRVLIYGKRTFDVTEDILKILNANMPKEKGSKKK